MPKFMLILGGADVDKRSGNPSFAPIMARYEAWVKKLAESEHLLGAHKLKDQTGTRLSVRGGEVVDGPFIETKEAIGGVFLIEAASLEEATELSRECPVLREQNGWVEVRAVDR
jgi:hypothetical protein